MKGYISKKMGELLEKQAEEKEKNKYKYYWQQKRIKEDLIAKEGFIRQQKELKWHRFYLELAEKFAQQSKDPRMKVGCIIVTENGIIYPRNKWFRKGRNKSS